MEEWVESELIKSSERVEKTVALMEQFLNYFAIKVTPHIE